ncbi:MAG: FlgO family outer membrane protein [Magnetospiraceae bacterium]
MKKIFTALGAVVLMASVSACTIKEKTTHAVQDSDIIAESEMAAKLMVERAMPALDTGKALVAVSFADVNHLDDSSPFGRIAAQQMAAAYANMGFEVREVLLRKDLWIRHMGDKGGHKHWYEDGERGGGEFILSRNKSARYANKFDVQAFVVGTYTVGNDNVYVTTKLVDAKSGRVRSGHSYTLAIGPDMAEMLGEHHEQVVSRERQRKNPVGY